MKLLTRAGRAASAESRWYETYSNSSLWESSGHFDSKTKKQTHEELVGLGSHPTAEEVNAIIGNDSWTNQACDECGKSVDQVVQIGQVPDYESATVNVCFPCLKKAVKLK